MGDPRRSNLRLRYGVTRSILDELHSGDIQRDQKEGESAVIRNIIDELHFPDIKGYQSGR